MDACEQLKRDLKDAVEERDRELHLARRRFWLGLLGLDFILDWEERGAVDRAVAGFLSMVQAGEIALGLQELYRILRALALATGRRSAARVLGKTASRMLGMVALSLLVVDVIAGYARWEEEEVNVRRRFTARIRTLRAETACEHPGKIFSELGISVP
jgi:hypothetical protein